MQTKIKQQFFPILLTWISISLVIKQFALAYELSVSWIVPFFILGICLIAAFIEKWWLQFPLYSLSYLLGTYLFFPMNQKFSLTWLRAFISEWQFVLQQLWQRQVYIFPEQLAWSLLLLTFILFIHVLIKLKKGLIPYLFMISYLLILEMFNLLNLQLDILIVVACALLFTLDQRTKKQASSKENFKAMLLGILLLSVIISGTYFSPMDQVKQQIMTWTIPIRNYANQLGWYQEIQGYGQLQAKTGYGEDDYTLGGPITEDNTILFEAIQNQAHYWRVESKYEYTGKGWGSAKESLETVNSENFLNLTVTPDHLSHETNLITLNFQEDFAFLPLPYGQTVIDSTAANFPLKYYDGQQRFDFKTLVDTLTLEWQAADYQNNDLLAVDWPSFDLQTAKSFRQYSMLPAQLPKRVYDLALEITQGKETLLEKVQATETFLKNNPDFRYSKVDVDYPAADEDYVEHFLFETKVGYCDNFSTAMVILLRTQGIPARWTKGFTAGEQQEKLADGSARYVIRNKDAHSWVEVYFEGYGWLPFDPTPGFDQAITATPTITTETTTSTTSQQTSSTTTESSSTTTTKQSTEESSDSKETVNRREENFFTKNLLWLLLIIIFSVIIFFLAKYYLYLLILLITTFSKHPLLTGYPLILKYLERKKPRPASQTLQQYAKKFEKAEVRLTGKFMKLTEIYEEACYGQNNINAEENNLLLKQVAKLLSENKRANN
ncbi:hypothetical protein M2139_002507 [Enterococcus sp. PF1-24]|uniref:DUF4129 domain-containing transglutaminase family protein n=1 Tax=unclassified Enterococcus TaxID=2608891 RepID=UPI002475A007|nr:MULTISPECIES: transglutaminase domain-containing protein [unclassified Enterococcus]MDH6365502.1 hypothetical protein [Enterococcus sp. PFB1-1]MDH6402603.1 hypothetical protein [Enterococcus sp. PF1-24]